METLTALLDRARAAGLQVRPDGDQLVLKGPTYLGGLASEILDRKAEVLAELAAERERTRREAEAPYAILPEGADPDCPPLGWTYIRTGPLTGCWIGPGGALAGSRLKHSGGSTEVAETWQPGVKS